MTTFETLVQKMRQAQKEHHVKRTDSALVKAQNFERAVDIMLNQRKKEDSLFQSKGLRIFDELR